MDPGVAVDHAALAARLSSILRCPTRRDDVKKHKRKRFPKRKEDL